MRLLVAFALVLAVCHAIPNLKVRDSDVAVVGAKALDYSKGYVVAKDANNILKTVKADDAWTKADLKGAAYVFVIIPIDQALIGTASAFAKANPTIQFILADPVQYVAAKLTDREAAAKKLDEMLDEAAKKTPLDFTDVPPNLSLHTPVPRKPGGAKSSVWEQLGSELLKHEKQVDADKAKGKKPSLIELNASSKAKLMTRARDRAAVTAKYWYFSRTNNQNMDVYECTHYPYQNIHYSRHPRYAEDDHTRIDGTSYYYFGNQRGNGSRYSASCDNNCTDLERARLRNAFYSFNGW